MEKGSYAVALVQRQVMVVQAARSHKHREAWIDVNTYMPFSDRVFLASPVPQARISSSDILAIFPTSDPVSDANGMLELGKKSFAEFVELNTQMQKKYERMFATWSKSSH